MPTHRSLKHRPSLALSHSPIMIFVHILAALLLLDLLLPDLLLLGLLLPIDLLLAHTRRVSLLDILLLDLILLDLLLAHLRRVFLLGLLLLDLMLAPIRRVFPRGILLLDPTRVIFLILFLDLFLRRPSMVYRFSSSFVVPSTAAMTSAGPTARSSS